jgi:hypothetical protein
MEGDVVGFIVGFKLLSCRDGALVGVVVENQNWETVGLLEGEIVGFTVRIFDGLLVN